MKNIRQILEWLMILGSIAGVALTQIFDEPKFLLLGMPMVIFTVIIVAGPALDNYFKNSRNR